MQLLVVAERSHPETEKIFEKGESLAYHMKEEGYMPHTNYICMERMKRGIYAFMSMLLYSVGQVEKYNILCVHCKKWLLTFLSVYVKCIVVSCNLPTSTILLAMIFFSTASCFSWEDMESLSAYLSIYAMCTSYEHVCPLNEYLCSLSFP